MNNARGSASVEFVLLAPVLVLLIVFVAALGRSVDVAISVRRAAESASRAASMVSSQRMEVTGRSRVLSELSRVPGCLHPRAMVESELRGTSVFVKVTASCELDRSGIGSVVPLTRRISSVSTEVVDVFTYR